MAIYPYKIISRQESRELGRKYSFSGKLCKFGNADLRSVINSQCQCAQHKQKIKDRQKLESRKQYLKKYYSTDAYLQKARKRSKDRYYTEEGRTASVKYMNSVEGKKSRSRAKKSYRDTDNGKAKTYDNNAKRRAQISNATPLWYEKELILELYKQSIKISKESGINHHVDHIVPLNSDIVCGLHCMANLQILEGKKNQSKGNRFWDDMP